MDKFITAIIVGMFAALALPFLMLFASLLTGTIFYFTWNTVAPIYFAGIIPTQLLHFTWWHSFLFMMVWGLLFRPISTSSTTK